MIQNNPGLKAGAIDNSRTPADDKIYDQDHLCLQPAGPPVDRCLRTGNKNH